MAEEIDDLLMVKLSTTYANRDIILQQMDALMGSLDHINSEISRLENLAGEHDPANYPPSQEVAQKYEDAAALAAS